MTCKSCGNNLPDDAKFCPVCGTPAASAEEEISDAEPVIEQAAEQPEVPSGDSWYQSAQAETPPTQSSSTYYAPVAPSIGSIPSFYRKAFNVLKKKPIRLWGLSLLYLVLVSLVSSLGALVPLISIPIVLLLSLGFTGILLAGYYGKECRAEQMFDAFRKDEIIRNGAGMCWMELWTMVWSFVPVMNIIKSYSYCFVPYILLTDKEIGASEALKKSMRMTDGFKGKMFGADILIVVGMYLMILVLLLLSRIPYIGWLFVLALILFILAVILFLPLFMGLVRTAFFEEISKLGRD